MPETIEKCVYKQSNVKQMCFTDVIHRCEKMWNTSFSNDSYGGCNVQLKYVSAHLKTSGQGLFRCDIKSFKAVYLIGECA